MRRLFLSLYVGLAVAFLVSVFGIPWLLNAMLKSPATRYGEQLSEAPQYLFEQELKPLPQSQWPQHMQELQAQFGYELSLLKLGDVEADAETKQRLHEGLATMPNTSQSGGSTTLSYMLLPIRGTDYVVKTAFSESETEQANRGLGGIYFLIEKHLAMSPAADRKPLIANLAQQFGVPMQLVSIDQTGLTPKQLQRLQQHQVIGINMNAGNGEHYFKLLADNRSILKIGPLPTPLLLSFITPIAFVGFALVFAAFTFLWVRPLWRDMKMLDHQAAAFGLGQFDSRVTVSTRSPVKVLALTFNSMASQIQEFIQKQREMHRAVSHELRTPLARLRFSLDMLSRAEHDTDRQRYVEGMHSDIKELDALVDESLTCSRLTSPGATELALTQVTISDWLDDILSTSRRLSDRIAIHNEYHLQRGQLTFDRRLMTRAVQNIVSNAVQHARTQILVSATEADSTFTLTIDDDGPGIPLTEREAIFAPFHRLDTSRSRDLGGYGLGLAIVKRICELHQAIVNIDDAPLGGARFRIVLGTP